MTVSFPSPEELFEERYRIVSVINRGGFGRVYRALQLELNRDVAIKVLQPITRDGADTRDEESRLAVVKKRFEREAQLVSQLRDSHTVVMHDFGTTPSGLLYMVLEYIDGRPLDRLIEEDGALEPERAVKIARQVLWSLQEAHALTMLHRDVKPANIMVFDHAGRKDQVKVLDFGLAKSAESAEFRGEDPDLTGDQVILGTPRYMSPEQIRGEHLEPSSDVYSLGLVLFEMLTGYKAVGGDSTMNTLARHLNDVPIRLPDDIGVPNGLRDIVNRMLVKQAPDRLQSAEDALDALEFWNASTSVLAGNSDPIVSAPAFLEERRKQTMMWAAIAVLSLFLFIAIISKSMQTDPVRPPEEIEDEVVAPVVPSVLQLSREEPRPVPTLEVVQFEEGEIVKADPPAGLKNVAVAETEPEPKTVDEGDLGQQAVVADAPDVGSTVVLEIDAGSIDSAPRYAEPVEPPVEKKSTKTPPSGKKKLKLDIGILK